MMAVYGGDGHGDARAAAAFIMCAEGLPLCVCVCVHTCCRNHVCVCTCLQTWSRKLSVMNANMAA